MHLNIHEILSQEVTENYTPVKYIYKPKKKNSPLQQEFEWLSLGQEYSCTPTASELGGRVMVHILVQTTSCGFFH